MEKQRPYWIKHDSGFETRIHNATFAMIRGEKSYAERALNAWNELLPVSSEQVPREIADQLHILRMIATEVELSSRIPGEASALYRFSPKKLTRKRRKKWSKAIMKLYAITMFDMGNQREKDPFSIDL